MEKTDFKKSMTIDELEQNIKKGDFSVWDWIDISGSQILTEAFIERHIHEINWDWISERQNLSEKFIIKYANKVKWSNISKFQKLSERFIEKHLDKVVLYYISKYQKLSERFIEKHSDKLDWELISEHQNLSEEFIDKHKNMVYWNRIAIFQELSESFINKYIDKLKMDYIIKYQKVSDEFIMRYNINIDEKNLRYKTVPIKKRKILKTDLYNCYDKYFIAYMSIRKDRHSLLDFQHQFIKDKRYKIHSDYSNKKESFGFTVHPREITNIRSDSLDIKVKIFYRDVARILFEGNQIRCCKLTVLE